MKKVGIYSGTFDPVHNGHIGFAKEAAEQVGLDKVFFLVEPRPRRKQGVKAFEHRTNMVRLAIKNYPGLGLIILDQSRFTPHGTLPLLMARFKGAELQMLIGDDMLNHLAEWPHVDELINSVHFVIGVRNRSITDVETVIDGINKTKGLNLRYKLFKTSNYYESSSKIKKSIKKLAEFDGIDPKVADYIKKNKLYLSDGE